MPYPFKSSAFYKIIDPVPYPFTCNQEQKGKKNPIGDDITHSWFVAFAPVEAPKIAVAVLAEHMGHGGSAAAPLAKEVIETYMKQMSQAPTGVPQS